MESMSGRTPSKMPIAEARAQLQADPRGDAGGLEERLRPLRARAVHNVGIAQALEVPAGTVASRLRRAREMFVALTTDPDDAKGAT